MSRNFSVHEAIDIVEAVLLTVLMICAVLFTLTRLDGIPRSTPLTHGLILAAGVIATRIIARVTAGEDHDLPEYQSRSDNIILIGANRTAASFIQMLRAYAPRRQPVIALLDDGQRNDRPGCFGCAGPCNAAGTRRDRERVCRARRDRPARDHRGRGRFAHASDPARDREHLREKAN